MLVMFEWKLSNCWRTRKAMWHGRPKPHRRPGVLSTGSSWWQPSCWTVAVTSVATWMIKPGAPSRLARYTIALPEADELLNGGRNMVSVSPDGSMVAYTGGLRGSADNTESQIYLRRIDNLEPTPVSGTENGGRRPFFSPGGEWLAFWSGPSTNKLMKVFSLRRCADTSL